MTVHLSLTELTPDALRMLTGGDNRILRRIEAHFGVHVLGHVGDWHVEGARAEAAADVLLRLAAKAVHGRLDDMDVEAMLRTEDEEIEATDDGTVLVAGRRHVRGKTPTQRQYLEVIQNRVLTIAIGPAGSGKTYLAVAAAVAAQASPGRGWPARARKAHSVRTDSPKLALLQTQARSVFPLRSAAANPLPWELRASLRLRAGPPRV